MLTEEEMEKKIGGLIKTRQEIANSIERLEEIPAVQFDSPQEFSTYKSILDKLYNLQK